MGLICSLDGGNKKCNNIKMNLREMGCDRKRLKWLRIVSNGG